MFGILRRKPAINTLFAHYPGGGERCGWERLGKGTPGNSRNGGALTAIRSKTHASPNSEITLLETTGFGMSARSREPREERRRPRSPGSRSLTRVFSNAPSGGSDPGTFSANSRDTPLIADSDEFP